MASKVKRDFEGPLRHLLVGTYDLRMKLEGRWVYLMVVLDAYSRAMLQLHTTFDNSEREVIRLADKIAGMLEKPATIYFCQRGGSKNKIYQQYIESHPMLKAPESSAYISNYINSFFARFMETPYAFVALQTWTLSRLTDVLLANMDYYNCEIPHSSLGGRPPLTIFNFGFPQGPSPRAGRAYYSQEQMEWIRAKAQRLRADGVPEGLIAEPLR